MYAFTSDHGKDGGTRRALLHRSFRLADAPRPIALCRLLGHRGRRKLAWVAEWSCDHGIPTRPGSENGVWGSAVPISDSAAAGPDWPMAAAAAIGSRLTADRISRGWRNEGVQA